jgi:hypothetical protein
LPDSPGREIPESKVRIGTNTPAAIAGQKCTNARVSRRIHIVFDPGFLDAVDGHRDHIADD